MNKLNSLVAVLVAALCTTSALAQAPVSNNSQNTQHHGGAAPASGPSGVNVPDPQAATIKITQYNAVYPNDKSADFGPFSEVGMAFLAGDRTLDSLPKVRSGPRDFVPIQVFGIDDIISWDAGGSRLGFPTIIETSDPVLASRIDFQIESADELNDPDRPSGLHFVPHIDTFSPTFVGKYFGPDNVAGNGDDVRRTSGPVDQLVNRVEYIGAAVAFSGVANDSNTGIRDWVNAHKPYWVKQTVRIRAADGSVLTSSVRLIPLGAPQGSLRIIPGQNGNTVIVTQPGGASVFIEEADSPSGPWATISGQYPDGSAIVVGVPVVGGAPKKFYRTRQ